MFTGIIEEVGGVARREGARLVIVAESILPDMQIGDSISVDGACLTVTEFTETTFSVEVSPESFARTTLGNLQAGHAVNLERAMAADGRFGGHFVQGHVDGVGKIESITEQGPFSLFRFRAPDEVARYMVPKGSITVDGISLTVVEPQGDAFAVAVIPETLRKTKLGTKGPGEAVNMEADMIGKHIYHYLKGGRSEGLSREFLAQHGYA